jgi:hypothetical protein
MFPLWQSWIDLARLGFDANSVIALRSLRLLGGGADGAREARQMVSEKVAAFAAGQAAAMFALATGKPFEVAAARALAPVKRQVRANRRRLSRLPR